MNPDGPNDRPRCTVTGKVERTPLQTARLSLKALRRRLWLPRPVRRVFGVVGGFGIVLFLIAFQANAEPEFETPFDIPHATSTLLDQRLPMEVNERVDRWVRRFLTTERATMEGYLVREGLYGGMIRDKLRHRGMPEELLYLAMIESGFLASATSPVEASGVWQFMGATARAFGLRMDEWVDERRDPIRATDAALDYLDELYVQFGSWYLAAAAYNAGPARVLAALERAGARDGGDEALYWEIIEHLPRETRQYVPKMLAAALLAQDADLFGFEVEPSLPYLFDRVLVPGGTPLTLVARALDVSPALMRELNPHLIRGVTPAGRSFLVRVPLGQSQRVVAFLSVS